MSNKQKMKWRLALKWSPAGDNSKRQYTGEAVLGWSVIRQKNTDQYGQGYAPPITPEHDPGEVVLIHYASAADMLEPMEPEHYAARLAEVKRMLPADCKYITVNFDPEHYGRWLKMWPQPDSHEARAAWAESIVSMKAALKK